MERDAFVEAGYGSQDIGFGERPAILVVDFQHSFTRAEWPVGGSPHIAEAVKRTEPLLHAARARGIPVAQCNCAWQSAKDMAYWKVGPLYDGHCFRGHEATRIEESLLDPEYDFHFTKSAPSIFFLTPLVTFLTTHRVDTTIITGCTTSGCVRASIVDSFSYGYRTIVPQECVGDQDREAHEANLRDVRRRYADVLPVADVMAYLDRFPVTEEQKQAG
ncbi:MAG: isochorismatase family protein [Pseudomonadota bacterium]